MCSFPDSTTENAPVAPKIPVPVSTVPVMFRISSLCHWPAPSSIPGVQFRKDCWHPQKPSSGRWLRRGQRFFRNWGQDGAAGATNQPGLPHAKGQWRGGLILAGTESGVVFASSTGQANIGGSPSSFLHAIIGIDLSRGSDIYGNSDTVMPPSINQPLVLYLGRPAQINNNRLQDM